MFKFAFILSCLVVSFSLLAQTRTIGGPVGGIRPHPPWKVPFDPDRAIAFEQFRVILLRRERACGITKNAAMKDTIMDSYHRLTLKNDSGECSIDAKALSCLNNPEFKMALDKIKQHERSVQYIAQEFRIDQEAAKKVYQFFIDLPEAGSEQ